MQKKLDLIFQEFLGPYLVSLPVIFRNISCFKYFYQIMYKNVVNKMYQTTLEKPAFFKGIGLHSGLNSEIKILPAKANEGIIFKRVDLKEHNLIKANYQNVSSAVLCTTLENSFGVKVSTVEHLLAALYIAEIDNALIEINNEEVPIMDGSAEKFLEVLNNSKIKSLSEKRKFLKILDKFELVEGNKRISIEPNADTLEIEFQLSFDNKVIGNQKNTIKFPYDNIDEISSSRTFCLFKDIEKIKKAGLARGGSLDNAIVVDEDKILNKEGLRNEKEFVNHKILDLIGDFMLSGYRILGKVSCYQGGHLLTNNFLRKLLEKSQIKKIEKLKFSENIIQEVQEKMPITA